MDRIILDEPLHKSFVVTDPTTGEAIDADALPTAQVFENATLTPMGVSVTVVKRTDGTGHYVWSVDATAANGFVIGNVYNVRVAATVGGVAAKLTETVVRVGTPVVYTN